MFKSIKFRLIGLYFVLVLIVLSIVGTFILNRLEFEQIDNIKDEMIKSSDSFIRAGSDIFSKDTIDKKEIDKLMDVWSFPSYVSTFVVTGGDSPKIIATSSVVDTKELDRVNALNYPLLDPSLLLGSFQGEKKDLLVEDVNRSSNTLHYATPIIGKNSEVLGSLYMVANLSSVYSVLGYARSIFISAVAVALAITSVMAYFMASSVTNPIKELTASAKKMSEGNFDQEIEVKGNDEIGKLSKMFNGLNRDLGNTFDRLELERSKLNTIFDYMAEGVVAIDRNRRLVHANPIARKILSLSKNHVGSVVDFSMVNIKDIDFKDVSTLSGEVNVQIKDVFYKVKYAPYKSEGRVLGVIVVLQDINEEHRLDVMRREFVANVSHELKTPITTIGSYTETMLDVDMDLDSIRNFLRVIDRENNRMARLVTDLLQLSNMDYKETKWNYEAVDTYDFLSTNINSLDMLIKEKHHKVTLDVPMDINSMYVDRHGADQVFRNIFSNALKYTRKGGEIKVTAKSEGASVEIIVEDNGIGIQREDLNKIFERFYRVEKSRSREMGGTGLGLSIAKEILESMGGRISIESEIGVGTKMTLRFPGVA
ncbi:ATP-binding protein [uncultured Peptoniphilus sp.]|uniref:HAMP domain-containing sensor histidine kinase n=1 Tax=uncultured Peptoniphilus sp. TaxID=254354 RepID=UPI002804F69A|nr:ATP-binding protein [uncultured Peptoniphilus sp.]